jgi:hypothetical protein
VIRVFDEASNVLEAHEQPGEFKELELRISNLDKPVAILYSGKGSWQNLYRKQFIR